jgi:hypothetical protein
MKDRDICRIPDNTSEFAVATRTDTRPLPLEGQVADSAVVNASVPFIEYELPNDFAAPLRADRMTVAERASYIGCAARETKPAPTKTPVPPPR